MRWHLLTIPLLAVLATEGLASIPSSHMSVIGAKASLLAQGSSGFMQYPSLSPSGDLTVFSQGGDLWVVPTGGGHAERFTSHEANELRSAFSPDGRWLAFESNRDGATSIYLVPVEQRGNRLVPTGAIKRLVVSDRSQALSGFSDDGKAVLFSSRRDPAIFRESGMYRAPINGGPVEALTKAKGEAPRIRNNTLTFSRGGASMERPRYRGSSNHDLWSMNLNDGTFTRRTSNRSNEAEAFPLPNGDLLLISSRDGQNNLWKLPAQGTEEDLVQLTTLAPDEEQGTIGHGIRDLAVSSDGSTAVFALWDELHRFDLANPDQGPTRIDVRVGPDQQGSPERRQSLDSSVREAALHPSGKAMAVASRGELLVRSTDDDHPTQRITDSHARDQWINWSPDGQKLYFVSDRGGHEGIWAASVSLTREDLEPQEEDKEESKEEQAEEKDADNAENSEATTEPADTKPDSAPDPKAIDAQDSATEKQKEAETDKAEETKEKPKNETGKHWAGALRFELEPVIVNEHANHQPIPSPDGRQMIYIRDRGDLRLRDLASGEDTLLLEGWWPPTVQWAADSRHIVYETSDLDFNSDIWIMDTQSPADAVNVTRHPDIDDSPQLSDDGKVLIFRSDRNQIGDNGAYDVYRVFLDESLEGMTTWERNEHFEEVDKKFAKKKMIDLVDFDEEAEETEPLTFENLDTAWRRAEQLTRFDGAESDLMLSPGGNAVMFSADVDGDSGLYKVDAMGKDRKKIVSGSVSDLRRNVAGTTLSYVSGGKAKTVPSKGGSAKTYAVDADTIVIVSEEQGQKFDEAARLFGRWFYHPDLKGLDWETISKRYGQLARTTRTPQAFNRIVRQLFGEVDGSHTGISGGGGFSASIDPIGYLGIMTRPVPGGYEITEVLEGSPAAHADSRLAVGEIITSVNDAAVAPDADSMPDTDLSRAMSGTRGREILLELSTPSEEEGQENTTRMTLITPISWSSWNTLAYEDEIRRNQGMVEEASDGRLGYLHIRSMNMPSVHEFEHQLYAAAHGKEGLVIDVRNNGGGWTTDVLLTSLTAPVHASTIPRGVAWEDAPSDAYPRDRRLIYAWSKPIVVLANEHSFSNAEIFTHAIKNAGRGRVVGEETYGGVISTGSFRLIDGSFVRRPFRGWRLPDGTDMENNGAVPDIRVERTPADEASGEDRQLQTAIDDLLSGLDEPDGQPEN